MAKNRQCGPDETSCPAGCCPEANWFCCPDNMYCAARAAEPIGLWAAASRAGGLIRSTLLVLGHLHELGLLGNKGAVSSSGSTVHVVRAAEPVGLRAAASGAGGLIRSTLLVLGHLHELGLLGDKGAVSSSGSTVHVVRAAEPVGLW